MKKMFLLVMGVLFLFAVTAFAADVPAAPAIPDVAKALTVAPAEKVGPKLKIDGYVFTGKLFSVSTEQIADLNKIDLTERKGSFLIKSEVGVRYGMIRPFIGYETLTHDYDIKTVGADVFFYSTEAMGSFGIRSAYSETKRLGIDTQKFLYTGVLWKF